MGFPFSEARKVEQARLATADRKEVHHDSIQTSTSPALRQRTVPSLSIAA